MSDNLLRRLARVNPTTAFIVAVVWLIAGLLLPGIVGAAPLFALAAVLVALTYTTWPVQPAPTRVFRIVMLALLFAAAVAKTL